jgi:hypothetical protein
VIDRVVDDPVSEIGNRSPVRRIEGFLGRNRIKAGSGIHPGVPSYWAAS